VEPGIESPKTSGYYAAMRGTRLLILLAVLLTLPGYGMAGFAQRSCQEQMRASSHVALASDCCSGKTDQATPCKRDGDGPLGKTGGCSACKAGYNCKSPQSFEPAEAPVLLVLSARPTLSIDPHTLLMSHSPGGLWRPPRQI
jgi:hypothetical protein